MKPTDIKQPYILFLDASPRSELCSQKNMHLSVHSSIYHSSGKKKTEIYQMSFNLGVYKEEISYFPFLRNGYI